MKEFTATTTQRNQVTIPAAVRHLLGIKPRDKVAFTIDDTGSVRLKAAEFSLESAYGSVRPSARPEDFEQLSTETPRTRRQWPRHGNCAGNLKLAWTPIILRFLTRDDRGEGRRLPCD